MFLSDHPIPDLVLRGIILGPLMLAWVTGVTRMIGLRTFSKLTAFDFVATIATGSLLAQAAGATSWPPFFQAALAVVSILGSQRIFAAIRFRSEAFRDAVENEPILLMSHGKFHESAMKSVRVAKGDLLAKLRQSNVSDPSQVEAVVLETTGDISVIHGSPIEGNLLKSVTRGPSY